MKVLPFKIPKSGNRALIVQEDKDDRFYDKLHQHPEIQMSYILKGTGTLVTGDTINSFGPGDLIVFGKNLPHVFKSDTQRNGLSHMLTIFFDRESFGPNFFDTEEVKELEQFFDQAESGFKVRDERFNFKKEFLTIKNTTNFKRIVSFIKLLYAVFKAPKEILSNHKKNTKYSDKEGQRISNVFDYCLSNFQEHISLNDIAEVAVLSPTAFCRFFKEHTNKTFYQFLLEVRVEHACNLLRVSNTQTSIADVAFASGFNSISNFNRYFKKQKGKSPSKYRKEQI